MKNTIFEITLFLAGLFFLFLSYKMYKKDWKAPTWICALIALLALLGTQSWIQGFFKTNVLSLGYEYADRLNKYQETVGRIDETVRKHQDSLTQLQSEIMSQQEGLGAVQEDIIQAQRVIDRQHSLLATQTTNLLAQRTDIQEQQQRLSNVESLLRNIYSNTRVDSMPGSDSNRVVFIPKGSNAVFGFFLLSGVPIPNSIQGYFGNEPMRPPLHALENVMYAIFSGDENTWRGKDYSISYVADPSQTGRVNTMNRKERDIYLNDLLLPWPKE